jgi:hypothetical protein
MLIILNYTGNGDWEDHISKPVQTLSPAQKKKCHDPISKNKSGMLVHDCNHNYMGGKDRRIMV